MITDKCTKHLYIPLCKGEIMSHVSPEEVKRALPSKYYGQTFQIDHLTYFLPHLLCRDYPYCLQEAIKFSHLK